jgi:hypothetical protein
MRPPRGFTGQMDLVLELRLADDTIVDRRSMRIEWRGGNRMTALAPADARSPTAEPEASELRSAMRPDQRQAIASLVARGQSDMSVADPAIRGLIGSALRSHTNDFNSIVGESTTHGWRYGLRFPAGKGGA